VRPRAQCLHLRIHRVLRRQHEHRALKVPRAKVVKHLHPGLPRKPHVENDEIVIARRGERFSIISVLGEIDGPALLLQPPLDELPDGRIVLDNEDLHSSGRTRANLRLRGRRKPNSRILRYSVLVDMPSASAARPWCQWNRTSMASICSFSRSARGAPRPSTPTAPVASSSRRSPADMFSLGARSAQRASTTPSSRTFPG